MENLEGIASEGVNAVSVNAFEVALASSPQGFIIAGIRFTKTIGDYCVDKVSIPLVLGYESLYFFFSKGSGGNGLTIVTILETECLRVGNTFISCC